MINKPKIIRDLLIVGKSPDDLMNPLIYGFEESEVLEQIYELILNKRQEA